MPAAPVVSAHPGEFNTLKNGGTAIVRYDGTYPIEREQTVVVQLSGTNNTQRAVVTAVGARTSGGDLVLTVRRLTT
jgi:hypothetical protein